MRLRHSSVQIDTDLLGTLRDYLLRLRRYPLTPGHYIELPSNLASPNKLRQQTVVLSFVPNPARDETGFSRSDYLAATKGCAGRARVIGFCLVGRLRGRAGALAHHWVPQGLQGRLGHFP